MLLAGPQDLKENKIKATSKSKVKFNSTEIKIWRKGSFDPFPVMKSQWVLSTRVSYTAPSWVPSAWVFPDIPSHSGDSHTDNTPAPAFRFSPKYSASITKHHQKERLKNK